MLAQVFAFPALGLLLEVLLISSLAQLGLGQAFFLGFAGEEGQPAPANFNPVHRI